MYLPGPGQEPWEQGGLHRNVGLVLATGMLPFVPRAATSLAKELI